MSESIGMQLNHPEYIKLREERDALRKELDASEESHMRVVAALTEESAALRQQLEQVKDKLSRLEEFGYPPLDTFHSLEDSHKQLRSLADKMAEALRQCGRKGAEEAEAAYRQFCEEDKR